MQADSDLRSQILATLSRFNALVAARDLQVLAKFAPGRQELEAFFSRAFARDTAFSWEWERIDISHTAAGA